MNLGTLGEKTEPSKTAFVSLADGIHYTYADLQRISDMVAADLANLKKARKSHWSGSIRALTWRHCLVS